MGKSGANTVRTRAVRRGNFMGTPPKIVSINSRSSPRQRAHHPILLRLDRFRRSATGVTTKIEKEHADTSGTEAVVGTGTRGRTIPHKEVESETVVR